MFEVVLTAVKYLNKFSAMVTREDVASLLAIVSGLGTLEENMDFYFVGGRIYSPQVEVILEVLKQQGFIVEKGGALKPTDKASILCHEDAILARVAKLSKRTRHKLARGIVMGNVEAPYSILLARLRQDITRTNLKVPR